MKITCVFSLFSGLETSLASGIWQPTGVPAVYKLLEALDKSEHDLELIVTCKGKQKNWKETDDKTARLHGFTTKLRVIAGDHAIPKQFGKLRGPLRELRQIFVIFRHYLSNRPDILYFDRANLWSAALFARYLKTPVVFRVMGVKHDMFEAVKSKNVLGFAMRYCYRSPFALVLCTQDGSGVEYWSNKALKKSVPRKIWFNGVDSARRDNLFVHPQLNALPKEKTIVIFLGSLEKVKGCEEFVEGFLKAWRLDKRGLYALVIGTGSMRDVLLNRVKMFGAEDAVSFIYRLTHSQVYLALSKCDIYVSLNRLGNLSNANLEAIKAGCAMIIPRSQAEYGIDAATDRLIPEKAAIRIDWNELTTSALSEAILLLHRNPERRKKLALEMKNVSFKLFVDWQNRIQKEVHLLEKLHSNTKKL